MSAQNLANIAEDLKEVWEPALAEFLNNADRTRAQFDSTSKGVVQGKYIKTASHIGRNSGFAFTDEGGQTPDPGHQTFMNEFVTTKKAVGRIKLSSEVIEDTSNNTAAVVDAMSAERDGLGKDARREINFLLHHEGFGVIAKFASNTTATVLDLDAATPKSVMRYLFDVVSAGGEDTGFVADIGTKTAPHTVAQRVPITAVDVDNKTVTVGSALSTTTSHYLFRANQGGSTKQLVPTSLLQIIDDTAPLYGADPADFPLWKSTVIDAGNAAVTEGTFEDAFDLLDLATGEVYGNSSALIITTHAVRKQYAASLQDRVRYAPLELKGGFKSNLTVECAGGSVGLLVDRDCRDYTAYLVNPNTIKRVVAAEWAFQEQSGSAMLYDKDDDSWHLLMRSRFEYMCSNRRANARIDNIGTSGSAF